MSDYPNSGILFQNRRKRTDLHPDYTGNVKVECPHCKEEFERDLAGWKKQGRKGTFLALKLKEPYQRRGSGDMPRDEEPTREHPSQASQCQPDNRPEQDDIPF